MGFAVIHIAKGTTGKGGGLGNHIDRLKDVLNADPEKTEDNFYVDQDGNISQDWAAKGNLQDRINERIKAGYMKKTAIRKDAVTHLDVVLTGSHKEMIAIGKEDETLKAWIKANHSFVSDYFGADNIVDFTVHLDERTPHIHCVVVPLTKDGCLSAKKVMGDRRKLTQLQTKYGEAMDKFGLERGIEGSTATHDSVREFYGRIDQAQTLSIHPDLPEPSVELPEIPIPPTFKRAEWAAAQNRKIRQAFKELKTAYNKLAREYQKMCREKYTTNTVRDVESARSLRSENCQLKGMLKHSNKEHVL